MTKNIVIVLLTIFLVLSIGINIFLLNSSETGLEENERLEKSSGIFSIFHFTRIADPLFEDSLIANDNNDFGKLANNALKNLALIQNEITEITGGYDPNTGMFIRPFAVLYVNGYFYYDNPKRSFAINFFNETMDSYLIYIDKNNIESPLPQLIDSYRKNYPPLFEDMSLVESMAAIDLIASQIQIDKYNFILKNK